MRYYLALLLLFSYYSCSAKELVSRDSLDKIFNRIGTGSANFESNIILGQRALSVATKKRDTLYIIRSLQKIGDLYWYKGIYSNSEDYYLKSFYLIDSLKYPQEYAYALYSIGWIECVQKKKGDKIYMLKKALAVYKKLGDNFGIISVLNALSGYYSSLAEDDQERIKSIDVSIHYLLEAIDIIKANPKLKDGLSNLESNIAEQYFLKKDYVNAMYYANSALSETSLKKNSRIHIQALVTKGKVYYGKNMYDSCIQFLTTRLDAIEKLSYDVVKGNTYLYLYRSYKKINDPKTALLFAEKYYEMEEKNNKELLAVKYEEVEANYKILKKEKEISVLTKQNELFQLKERQRFYALVVASAIILLICSFLFYSIRQNKRIRKLSANVSSQNVLLEEKHKEISDSITYAKRIQDAILPSRYTLTENLKNGFVLFQPKDIVSGDFYWLERVGGATYFAAADCTGHGVPGAMVSVVCANALSKALLEENISDTGKLLDRTRELVIERFENSDEDVKDGMDISLCKLEGNQLQWSGANNPLWLIRKGASEVEEIKADKQPIGKTDNPTPFTAHTISLNQGDSIYIFTDGYADQFGGENGKKFMYKPLKELLLGIQNDALDNQKERLKQTFATWKGELEQVDDVCVIGVRV